MIRAGIWLLRLESIHPCRTPRIQILHGEQQTPEAPPTTRWSGLDAVNPVVYQASFPNLRRLFIDARSDDEEREVSRRAVRIESPVCII
ncbi:hypothetical protein F4808DRAFT_990 [Astrocystis sublimbata]|nr:hypothetical protein F4808DRAFT_990 [Astrocystis sublimbata]